MSRIEKLKRIKLSNLQQRELQRKLGYVFVDSSILLEALQAAGNGVSQIGGRKITDGNKRLAMLGDSVLQLALLDDWFVGGDSRGTGSTSLRTIGNNHNLNKRGQAFGLRKFINKHRSVVNDLVPQRTMSATVEALIGAVFIDSNQSLKDVKIAMKGLGLFESTCSSISKSSLKLMQGSF
ncbi:hypothetical protein IFR05_017012 [Cadophora sp. M221]|nr:hypothetical protein IFR05_017012 [Cadophora sp. M221]